MDPVTLLLTAQHAGLVIKPMGDRLLVRGPSGAEPVVRAIAKHKAEVLAALAPSAVEARRWQQQYTARTFEWCSGKRTWQEARRLAWGDLQNEWHERHGKRWPASQCAGCDEAIGRLDALDLPDGGRVHFEPIDCLVRFGKRWRAEADAALVAFCLEKPLQEKTQ